MVFLRGVPGSSINIRLESANLPTEPPDVVFSADPMVIHAGESSLLTWVAKNAESVFIDQDLGFVDAEGSTSVSPVETTTYTITAVNSFGSDTAEVTISYQNSAPTVNSQMVAVDEDDSVLLTLSGTDIDNDDLSYSIVSHPKHGVLTGSGHQFSYTPNSDYHGIDAFTFLATDGALDSPAGTVTIRVKPVNDAPVATDDTISTDEAAPTRTVNVLANDIDIDGDTLAITAFSQPSNGMLTDHGGGDFLYVPIPGFNGTDSFTYTVDDGHGGTDTATVWIEVVPATFELSILNPADGTQFTADTITVSGTVNRSDASVYINGIAAKLTGDQFAAENIRLVPGTNRINVLAEDDGEAIVASVNVILQAVCDLEPVQIETESLSESDDGMKVSGQAMITVINNGTAGVVGPYRIVLFEDINLNGSFEATQDHPLGEAMVPGGLDAGKAITVAVEYAGNLLFRDNRLHACIDSDDSVEELNESNNTIRKETAGPDLSASRLRLEAGDCPESVDIGVRIGNAGAVPIAQGVLLSVYSGEPDIAGSLIATLPTTRILMPGDYEDIAVRWNDPAAGMNSIVARIDDDGSGVGFLDEVDETNNQVHAQMVICPSTDSPIDSLSGQAVDAVNGDFLAGVAVILREIFDGNLGSIVNQTITDENGGFAFTDIEPGSYLLSGEIPGYLACEREVHFSSNEPLTPQNLVLSPLLGTGEIRVVLTWEDEPADLELHLTAPNPDGCRHHCFYWNRGIPGAGLDLDDSDAYGPETITLTQVYPGRYRFYVHDFSNRFSTGSTALSESKAALTVYFGSGQSPVRFTVPDGTGTVWHVFNLAGTGTAITPINKITQQSHPGRIDFPVITSHPVTRTTYEEPYTYQVKAQDPDLDDLAYALVSGPEGMNLDPFSGFIEWTPANGQGGVHPIEVRVNDGRCGEDVQRFEISVDYLPVVQLSIEPISGMNPGGDITLTWDTDRAETVSIDQGIGDVSTSGSMILPSPDQPTAFTLTAVNRVGQTQRIAPKKPVITGFNATCVAAPGEASQLSWASEGAVSCSIDHGVGEVPTDHLIEVTPWSLPATYRLTCSNGTGSAVQEIPIAVCRQQADLDADIACDWAPGDPVTLRWTTQGVDNCSILSGIGSVATNGSLEVVPESDPTHYILKCDGALAWVEVANPRSVTLAASAYRLTPGESTTLFWKSTCIDACSLDQEIGEVSLSGSVRVTPDRLPTTYTLTAVYDHGEMNQSVTIDPHRPSLSFSTTPSLIKSGEQATLAWTTDRATTCSIEPDIGEVPVNGSLAVSPDHNTTYTMKAVGPGGTTYGIASVTYAKPTASIYADREHLDGVGEGVTLTWVFSNADTCEIDQGIGEVPLGGSVTVHPGRTTTYTIFAEGPGGMAIDSVTVAFTTPTAVIHADRETLDEGETAVLTWNCTNADSCIIDQGIGAVQPNGSIAVDPSATTTYTITAVGPGGRVTDTVTLTCLTPEVAVQIEPAGIVEGESAVLTWQADHAAECVIEPDVGQVDSSGSITVSPSRTTTYRVTATGRGGEASSQTTLTVINPPSIRLIEPDGENDVAHNGFTIRWSDNDYDSDAAISLYYDINNTGADGTLIAGGIGENPDGAGDQYLWETSNIPAGIYYVYAKIEDGVNAPVIDYSDGTVRIDHTVSNEIKLTAGDGAAYDYFGQAVGINGDFAVVGSAEHGDCGTVYVFKQAGVRWDEQIQLIADDIQIDDQFGRSVAISGDTIAVGAPNGNGSAGAVYIFVRDGSTWWQQARLTAGDGVGGDDFGACLAISGDTLVAGAPKHDGDSGAVYVFRRENSLWGEPVKLVAGDDSLGGRFGASVAISDDVLIAGAPSIDNSTGSAFVFRRGGSDWNVESRLIASDAADWEYFGSSVSICGEYAIVGNSAVSEADVEGAARIFKYDGSTWTEQVKINAGRVNAGESFGRSVSIFEDVAAVGEPNVWNDAGAVYLFQRIGSQWIGQEPSLPGEGEEGGELPPQPEEQIGREDESGPAESADYHKLTPGDGAANDFYGKSLAMDDVHIIVGAVYDDDNGYESGSAYIYPLFSVSIDAEPEIVYLGGEGAAMSTLSWTSRGTGSVSIAPDIGDVATNGSLTVAPMQTTTYTITGTKDGAAVTDSVTVTVVDPSVLPIVTMSATPQSVAPGDSVVLSWSADNATFVSLDNGIGEVPVAGNLAVFPEATTSYTVTAINNAGSASAQVTITVVDAPPTVTLTAEPSLIDAGETAVLTWTSTYADSVTIEPGIGIAEQSGTLAVSPRQTTDYTITAVGSGGATSATAKVTVVSPIGLQILSPVNGDSIDRPEVMVHGTFTNETEAETGITVNGMVAAVVNGQFVANNIPLEEGVNTITVIATDSHGFTQTAFATVTAVTPEHHIRLIPSMTSGSSPLTFTLIIDSSFSIEDTTISYTGPGPAELVEVEPDEYRVSVDEEGITWFTADVLHKGVVYSDTVAIMVVDEAQIDALLQQKWADMKSYLAAKDVKGAVMDFDENKKDLYEGIFSALFNRLPQIVSDMQDISLISINDQSAKYRIRRIEKHNTGTFEVTYYVYFIKDENGIWRIYRF
jgi:hypothetical protein